MGIDEPVRIGCYWDSALGVEAVEGTGGRTGDKENGDHKLPRRSDGKSRAFNDRWERPCVETTGRHPEGRNSGLQWECVEVST